MNTDFYVCIDGDPISCGLVSKLDDEECLSIRGDNTTVCISFDTLKKLYELAFDKDNLEKGVK